MLNRPKEAVEAYEKAIELTREGGRPQIRMDRAKAVVRTGDYMAAAAAVEAERPNIEKLDQSNRALVWFLAAGVLADAATAANADPKLDKDQQMQRADDLRHQAINALSNAHEAGQFDNNKTDSPLLSKRFQALRIYPEFQQLLQDAEIESPSETDPDD